jgi:Reverse transcriptase (RNA-dependent DNA polymerase)
MLDIANFYDSINLAILKNKFYELGLTKIESKILDMLFLFLKNWNRKFRGNQETTVGLPQAEFGEAFRLMSFLYLEDYDKEINNICKKYNAKYTRYADDQMIFIPENVPPEEILIQCSQELFKINLSINSSKVKIFEKEDFQKHFSFEIFKLLEDDDTTSHKEAIKIFFDNLKNKVDFAEDRVLKRMITKKILNSSIGQQRYDLLSKFFNPSFLSSLKHYELKKLIQMLPEENKKELLEVLFELVGKIHFNSFHYNLLKCLRELPDSRFDFNSLNNRIEELRFIPFKKPRITK